MNKRGLSTIVATVLIVLLSLVAIALVWSFISPAIKESGTSVALQQKCFEVEVRPTNCNATTGVVNVQLTRGNVADIDKVTAIIEQSDGSTKTAEGTVTQQLSTVSITVVIDAGKSGKTAQAAARVKDESGKTALCSPSVEKVACT
ncbi:hypothetical protein HYV50_00195 [Candidatus Pacearchaeota archaeon]|nr:hypothetical protein [Candidatus Pacearchaeota archaeon]